MNRVAVYTSAIGNYDWILQPRVRPDGVDFLRFSDRKPWRLGHWAHRDLPPLPAACSERLMTRLPKLCPHEVLPDHDIVVWIDGNIEVIGDLTPLLEQFVSLGTDVAMFPHPKGRTVSEEIDFAIKAEKILPEFFDAADQQRIRYREEGVSDEKIVEASIIFYRLPSDALRMAGEKWWGELATYTQRDQISQPFAMNDPNLDIHKWDWHFDQPNPYFRRVHHRPKALLDQLRTGARFLGDSRWDFRLVRAALNAGRWVRDTGRSALGRSK